MRPTDRPTARLMIEPTGPRSETPREHTVHLRLDLGTSEPRHADRGHVAAMAHDALAGYSAGEDPPSAPRVRDVTTTRKGTKAGAPVVTRVFVGIEATVSSRGRPAGDAVAASREVLAGDGYRVAVRERRECTEPSCKAHVTIDWDRADEIPSRWYSKGICGAHNYRRCSGCDSVYVLSCVNAAGQAPSVHCEVCGQVIIEWGGSKVWTAERVEHAEG